jgi:hypothetical protein
MSTEQQDRIDHLESLLRDRDRQELEAKAVAAAAAEATANATDAATRLAAAAAERETVRRGAFVSYYLSKADPLAPIDAAAIEEAIPATGWPPGTDPSQFTFTTGAPLRADETTSIADTVLGKALAALAPLRI